jgi:hypothetical protein
MSLGVWTGVAALVGAIVGGALTFAAAYLLEGHRQDFEHKENKADRDRQDAGLRAMTRGAARVMQLRYERAEKAIKEALRHECWLPEGSYLGSVPGPYEEQLVAAAATADEWLAIVVANASLMSMIQARDRARDRAGLRLRQGERELVVDTIEKLKAARLALDRLAGPEAGNAPIEAASQVS